EYFTLPQREGKAADCSVSAGIDFCDAVYDSGFHSVLPPCCEPGSASFDSSKVRAQNRGLSFRERKAGFSVTELTISCRMAASFLGGAPPRSRQWLSQSSS